MNTSQDPIKIVLLENRKDNSWRFPETPIEFSISPYLEQVDTLTLYKIVTKDRYQEGDYMDFILEVVFNLGSPSIRRLLEPIRTNSGKYRNVNNRYWFAIKAEDRERFINYILGRKDIDEIDKEMLILFRDYFD